jgi:hypothetical protein
MGPIFGGSNLQKEKSDKLTGKRNAFADTMTLIIHVMITLLISYLVYFFVFW